ncbi:hypothetical protein GNP80_01175 [Aliivibrio fischeri]|uniref:hypothetical protein n=1 Tax=Aliivibrio fischeri TaxID=668 RepID=UPI0012D87E65|nr:hypothetical protein [Aliivibrio fischeri]MUK91058.1 hypothetical protein [Aliivibrio fischeri]
MIFRQLFLFLTCLFSPISQAHVQWFVAPEEMKNVHFEFDPFYLSLFLFVILSAMLGITITNHRNKPKILAALISAPMNIRQHIFIMVFVIIQSLFFSLQVIQGGFLAPNIVLAPEYLSVGLVLQLAIVVSAAVSIMLSGIFVILTTLFMIIMTPFFIWVNYAFEFLSIGLFMLLCGAHVSNFDKRVIKTLRLPLPTVMWERAVAILRIGIGLQLAILAMTEKLIYPGLAVVFIEMFPFYNIFPSIGLTQGTNMHFVFFVGMCELLLGLLLASGVANRLSMLMATFAFVTTAIIHGMHEVEGHLPIFAAAFVLLLAQQNGNYKQSY